MIPDAFPTVYIVDTNAMIETFGAGLDKGLRELAKQGRLKFTQKVFDQLRMLTKRRPMLQDWNRKYGLVTDLDFRALSFLPGIEKKYGPSFRIGNRTFPGLWNSPVPSKAGDGEIIALAKARNWMVISGDQSVRAACFQEGVAHDDWWKLAEAGRLLTQPLL